MAKAQGDVKLLRSGYHQRRESFDWLTGRRYLCDIKSSAPSRHSLASLEGASDF